MSKKRNRHSVFWQRWFLGCLLLFAVAGMTGCRSREAELFQDNADVFPTVFEKTEEEEELQEPEKPVEKEAVEAATPAVIYVDVCGAVKKPGVYELAENSRVFQAVEMAGGYLPEAAQNYLNRAGILSDGQQIYIPTKEELAAEGEFSARAASEAATEENGSQDSKEGGFPVNLNTAGEEELTSLAGIGASKAQAILAYREENGGFSSIEELMNVEGIKEGTFSKIKDKITVK